MRHEWALLIVLLSASASAGESHDPAYVDSALSKATPDPARADGGSVAPMRMRLPTQSNAAQGLAQQAEAERQFAARMAASQAAGPGQPPFPGGATYGDPSANTDSQASPMQQLGSALLQDAAGVADTRIQREIGGADGIVVPQQPVIPEPAPGW